MRKHQGSVTDKHTQDGISAAGMHKDCFYGSLQAASQGRKSSAGQTLTSETSHILFGYKKKENMEHPDWPKCKVTAEAGKRARLQRQIPRHNHRCIFAKPQNMEIDFQDMKNSSQVITSAGTVLNTIMFTHFNSFSLLFHHILFLPEPYCRPIYVNRRYDGKLGKDGGKRSHRPKTGFISTPTTGHTPNHSAKRPIHCQATRRSPIRLTAPSITRSTE